MKAGNMCTEISILKSGDLVVEGVEDVIFLAYNHFKDRFQKHLFRRLKLHGVSFKALTPTESTNLEL